VIPRCLRFDRASKLGDDQVVTKPKSSELRRAKLTKRVVDSLEPGAARAITWDTALPGFGIRVETSGRKTFIARYRAGGGRTGVLRQATIGRYGPLTVDEARVKAKKLLGAAASGGDPVGDQRSARKAGITVAEVCDWYLKEAEAGRILGRRGRPIKQSTLVTDRERIEAHVKPLLEKRTVRGLTMRDMEEMQADIAAGKTVRHPQPKKRPPGGIVLGGRGVGARTLAMMSAIFGHAVRRQIVDHNPAKGVRKFASRPRKFRLSVDQVRALGAAMKEAASESPTALATIKLMLLSGFRRGEALSLRPEWIMPAGGVDFPDTKAGPQARPIGKPAMQLLARQIEMAGPSTPWVFPADRGTGHYVGVPRILARISMRANLKGVTPHSLRHTFASIAAELGYSELTIAGLLGHAAGSVTAGYVHLDQALVSAADRVAGVIADALDGVPEAKVIPLREEGELTFLQLRGDRPTSRKAEAHHRL
jgi:integrase